MAANKRVSKVSNSSHHLSPLERSLHYQELGELMTSPPAGVTVALADEANLLQWKVTMEGPTGSPYNVSSRLSALPLSHLYLQSLTSELLTLSRWEHSVFS